MLEKELEQIGLNEKEAKVYLATLELGQATVQEISTKSGVNRATTYFIIENLMKRGLASSFYKGKKQFFLSADPDTLDELLEKQKQEIEKKRNNLQRLLPQLRSVNNKKSEKPVVKYYEGKEGIISMIDEVMSTTKDTTVSMAYSNDAVSSLFNKEEREHFTNKRKKQNVKTKVLYTSKDLVLPQDEKSNRRRVPFDKFPIVSDIALYDKQVRIASFKNRQIGILIEDEEITNSLKAIFDLAWEGAEKYQ